MNDPKPLRQEDYAAMAEELRRAQADNETLRKAFFGLDGKGRTRRERMFDLFKRVAKTAAGSLVIGVTLAAVWWMGIRDDPNARKTPCYFVRHAVDDDYERTLMPWDPWYVIRSAKHGATNYAVVKDRQYVHFNTKAEAWHFIEQWDLPACK